MSIRTKFFAAAIVAAAASASILPGSATAQSVEAWVVTIDALTTQPVVTDFIPPTATGSYVVLSQGASQVVQDNTRYDEGWFGPTGQSRLQRGGQLVLGGMPFGALLGRFGSNSWVFLGLSGASSIQPVDDGVPFEVALNMSNTDLANMDGAVTLTVIYVPDDSADVAQVAIHAGAPHVVPTGLIATEGDKFVVLPYGALRIPTVEHPFTGGWFRPEGTTDLQRSGQPLSNGPMGALSGTFGLATNGFVLGEGGTFAAQIVDYGNELSLFANMSAADMLATEGRFLVSVLRVPAVGTVAVENSDAETRLSLTSSPNPTPSGTTIRFALEESSPVRLRVADANGRWVRTVVNGELAAGQHAIDWDGRDDDGRGLPAGAYFYQMSTASGSRTGRVVIAR